MAASDPTGGKPTAAARSVRSVKSVKKATAAAPAANQPLPAAQKTMQAKGLSGGESGDADEEAFDEDAMTMSQYLKQAPAWLTSMVVHMVLLLILAVITFKVLPDAPTELVIGNPEVEEVSEEELDDGQEDVEEDSEALSVDDEFSEIDFEVDSEVVEIPTENDELDAAMAKVEVNPLATTAVESGDLLAEIGGLAAEGLGGRTARGRGGARRGGGTPGSENAVDAGLRWLAAQQLRDGSWSFLLKQGGCAGNCSDAGTQNTKMGATGLALLPFLGAGYTHQDGKYKDVVGKGLEYLTRNMKVANNAGKLYEDGLNTHGHMYSHGLCSIALCEAYGMTQDKALLAPAQMAINYIANTQHPTNGGWRYNTPDLGDTSVVGWQIMAMKSAHISYLKVNLDVVKNASKFLDSVQFSDGAAYGYMAPKDRPNNGATTAIGLLCRMYMGWDKDRPAMAKGVDTMVAKGPSPQDMYYNYYATLAIRNLGNKDPRWKDDWNPKMREQLISTQVIAKGVEQGSWSFQGGHANNHGGRLYNTAMAVLTLEVYYRYKPVYQTGTGEGSFHVE